MNQKRIIFFSSDSTDLYRADVFRVLALPKGYTIQFRYERQYVLEVFWDDPEQLRDKKGVIFFLAGNDLGKLPAQRLLQPYAIRSCKVKDVFPDENTEQLILILELGNFVDCVIEPATHSDKLPLSAFVTEVELNNLRDDSWISRVKAVERHFKGNLFYRIVKILRGKAEVIPRYSEERRLSYFKLEEESDYSIECSCYDSSGGGSLLRIRYDSEEIDLDNSFESGVRAKLDTRRLPLTTRSLKSRSAPAFFTFYSPANPDDTGPFKDPNHVRIGWLLTRKWWKTLAFGLLTILAAVGLALSQTSLKNQSGNWMTTCEVLIKLIGVVAVGFAAAQLFKFFNKT